MHAARVMAGEKLADLGLTEELRVRHCFVKSPVFPFNKFRGVDSILGPEMKSTGEVMGIGHSFSEAFLKSQAAAGQKLPAAGKVFISVRDGDKARVLPVARELLRRGFSLVATSGTAEYLNANGAPCERVNKVLEGRPHIVDQIKNGDIVFIVNTT